MAGTATGPTALAATELAGWWAAALVLQVLFISTLSWPELAVAAGGALLAAVAARAVRRAAAARTGGRARLLTALLLFPGALLTDTARLAAATARVLRGHRVTGRFHTVRLRRGSGTGWACGLLSATPGLYVVDLDPSGPTVLAHTLPGRPTPLETALTTGGRR
ncbi:hypothetical protein AB0F18_24025 [Streptomyces sp. NPDC029216]|uniref:hypothetical protein n=1 Tax=Streptomyces sp. NPDC029216 TaxID=3154701 RepID=UPI0033F15373